MTFLADAGMAFPADLAGGVTIEVASLAYTAMAFPADIALEATIGVTSLADARMVTLAVTDLANAAPVDVAGVPECGGGVVSWGDRLSPGVWCRGRTLIQNNFDSQFINSVRCDSANTGCTVPSDGSAGSFGTLLSGPVTDDMTYGERLEALGGDSYDYVEVVDSQPGSFDYDDPRDYEEWCDCNDVDIE